ERAGYSRIASVGPEIRSAGYLPHEPHDHGAARCDDEANENPNVTPMVNSQSGAARLIPRRTPASRKMLDEVGCQMKPSRAELFGSSPCVLSPFTSPTSRRLRATGNSPITPQIQNGRASARPMPPPLFSWIVHADPRPLPIPIASNPPPRALEVEIAELDFHFLRVSHRGVGRNEGSVGPCGHGEQEEACGGHHDGTSAASLAEHLRADRSRRPRGEADRNAYTRADSASK